MAALWSQEYAATAVPGCPLSHTPREPSAGFLIATCRDCQPGLTVIYQCVANRSLHREAEKVDSKRLEQRRHLTSLCDDGRSQPQRGAEPPEATEGLGKTAPLLLNDRTFSPAWEK